MSKFPIADFWSSIKYPSIYMLLCWIIFLSDSVFHLQLYRFGVSPRTVDGLWGILFSPFIHGDIGHILNNTLPILVLGAVLFYFYKPIAWQSVLWIYIISGVWLWIGGRNNAVITNYHFGASILIYGLATFIFFSGVFRKHKSLMMVSAFVVFMYGSITYGIFPFDTAVSWEGHLFGAIAGLLVAFNYRKEGPQAEIYQWSEEEVDLEAEYNRQLEIEAMMEQEREQEIKIVYHYKKSTDSNEKEK